MVMAIGTKVVAGAKGKKVPTAGPGLGAIRSPRVEKTKLPVAEGTKVLVFGSKVSRVVTTKLPFSAGTKVPVRGMKTPCPVSTEFPVSDGTKERVEMLRLPWTA